MAQPPQQASTTQGLLAQRSYSLPRGWPEVIGIQLAEQYCGHNTENPPSCIAYPQIGREGVALSTLETVSNLDGPPLSCGWLNIVSLRNQPNSPPFASLGASSISVAESGLLELSKKKSLTAHFVLIVLGAVSNSDEICKE